MGIVGFAIPLAQSAVVRDYRALEANGCSGLATLAAEFDIVSWRTSAHLAHVRAFPNLSGNHRPCWPYRVLGAYAVHRHESQPGHPHRHRRVRGHVSEFQVTSEVSLAPSGASAY